MIQSVCYSFHKYSLAPSSFLLLHCAQFPLGSCCPSDWSSAVAFRASPSPHATLAPPALQRGFASVWSEPWTAPEKGLEPKWVALRGPASQRRKELLQEACAPWRMIKNGIRWMNPLMKRPWKATWKSALLTSSPGSLNVAQVSSHWAGVCLSGLFWRPWLHVPSQKSLSGEARRGGNLRTTVLLKPSFGDKDWRVFPLPGWVSSSKDWGEKEKTLLLLGSMSSACQRPAIRAVRVECPPWVPCRILHCVISRGQPCTAGQDSRWEGMKLDFFSPPHLSPLPWATSWDFEI